MENKLNHFDQKGNAVMVDVSDKPVTHRTATAAGSIQVSPEIMAAVKSGNVYLGFADRFTGTLIITGEISDVMSAMTEVVDYFRDTLGYVVCKITKR